MRKRQAKTVKPKAVKAKVGRAKPAKVAAVVVAEDASRSDIKLVERAIRNDWKIPPEAFALVTEKMVKIATGRDQRKAIAAARVLTVMHAQNERHKPRQTTPQPKQQVVPVVLTETDVESLRRSLIDRVNSLCLAGGVAGAGQAVGGDGDQPAATGAKPIAQ